MVMSMKKLSDITETYLREEAQRNTVPKSEMVQKIEEFKSKKPEIIKPGHS